MLQKYQLPRSETVFKFKGKKEQPKLSIHELKPPAFAEG